MSSRGRREPGEEEEEESEVEELASTTLTYREAMRVLRRTTIADYLYLFLLIVLALTDLAILHIPPTLVLRIILQLPTYIPVFVKDVGPAMTYLFMFWTLGVFALYIHFRDTFIPPIFYFMDAMITGFSSLITFLYTHIITLLVFTGLALYQFSVLYTQYFAEKEKFKDAVYDAFTYGVRVPFSEAELKALGFTDEELDELYGRIRTEKKEESTAAGSGGEITEGGEEG